MELLVVIVVCLVVLAAAFFFGTKKRQPAAKSAPKMMSGGYFCIGDKVEILEVTPLGDVTDEIVEGGVIIGNRYGKAVVRLDDDAVVKRSERRLRRIS